MSTSNQIAVDREKGNFHFETDYAYDAGVGLSEDVVKYVSGVKDEESWLLDFRLKALAAFEGKPLPTVRFPRGGTSPTQCFRGPATHPGARWAPPPRSIISPMRKSAHGQEH